MNQFSSIFGQILQVFSKGEFYAAVKETKSDKGAKGFTWGGKAWQLNQEPKTLLTFSMTSNTMYYRTMRPL